MMGYSTLKGRLEGRLGSHSWRKMASSTQAGNNGFPKREGKKVRMRVSDVHDDIDLPFPGEKDAGKLCMDGPCKNPW